MRVFVTTRAALYQAAPVARTLAACCGQPVCAAGDDIVFQKGAYQPGTVRGRNLLGRQLARTTAVRAAALDPAGLLTFALERSG